MGWTSRKRNLKSGNRAIGFTVALLFAQTALAQSPVTITVKAYSSIMTVPVDFVGLSFGSATMQAYVNGTIGYFFAPYDSEAVSLFRTLRIENMRIAGGTALWAEDGSLPARPDIDAFFGFVKKIPGLKVIYSLPLFNASDTADAAAAKYIWQNYGRYLDCFELDNEPDWHSQHTYPGHTVDPQIYESIPGTAGSAFPSYIAKWRRFAETIADSVPSATFAGPSTGSNWPVPNSANTSYENQSWTANFADSIRNSTLGNLITQHNYVGQAATGKTPQQMVNEMISQAWDTTHYPDLYNACLVPAVKDGFGFRLEESNSFSGSVAGGSNSFATALWTLDYLNWWAQHGAAGVNFHVNEWGLNAVISKSGVTYGVYPMAYGIKAFDIGGFGKVDSVAIANPDGLNLTAYAVHDSGSTYVTIINKEQGPFARNAQVAILTPADSPHSAGVMYLSAPNNNLLETTGVTLGGAVITNSCPFAGRWTILDSSQTGQYVLTVHSSSAAIVKIGGQLTAVTQKPVYPDNFSLLQNYPNPFNPSSIIGFTLNRSGEVSLKIYNVLGEPVDEVAHGFMPAGSHSYNVDMQKLPSGLYFYTLRQGANRLTKKMLLLK